jgi:uncharacterized membrane protein YdbT with pleckstrin-like domain
LEANHIAELDSIRKSEQEKVDSLHHRLGEVDEQCQKLHSEMTAQSKVLTETSKRWVAEISALDRGMAGNLLLLRVLTSLAGFRLAALLPTGGWKRLRISPASGCQQTSFVCWLVPC